MQVLDYKGYTVIEEGNKIIVENIRDFNPVHTFECGQCFRWSRQKDGSYTGVARGRVVRIHLLGSQLEVTNTTLQEFRDIWYDYLDLGRDYSEIKRKLDKDEIMHEAIQFGYGIRLLRQELWETLISFILSSNNIIPKIKRGVSSIAKVYGEKIEMDGEEYYTFPEAGKLSGVQVENLEICSGGYRCKYIVSTAQKVYNREVFLENLEDLDTVEARCELEKLSGVGPKVADCVLLYSGTKYDVFPTDVWVKRVMEELYFKREASFKEIREFARDYFGELAGFAQQYLFYYAREHKIGTSNVSTKAPCCKAVKR